jgi:hypothetical protein
MLGDPKWSYRGISDLDGDGRADAIWVHANGPVELWFSTPGGVEATFASKSAGRLTLVGDQGD